MPEMFCFFVKRYAVREDINGGTQYARLKRATRSTQGDVTLMVMDCGINFIRFRIQDQVYCNKSNNILFKTFILPKNKCLHPLLQRLGTVLHSSCM